MTIGTDEKDLIGKWEIVDGRIVSDATTERIMALIERTLEKVAVDNTGWETLYRDPEDGRYWELTYPEGSLHGGGPPRLTHLSLEEARAKYGNV